MELIQLIDNYLEIKENKFRDEDKFHVSELGYGKRKIFQRFKEKHKVEKPSAQLKRIYENGNFMHLRYYKYFTEMGILRVIEIQAIDNDIFSGTADCIISGKDGVPWVVELKSCNSWVFKKLEDMKEEHKIQILFYMYFLKLNNGIVLYENKDSQEIKIFKIYMTNENQKLVEKLINEFTELKKKIDNNEKVIFDDYDDSTIKPEDIKLENLIYGIN